LTTLPRPSKKSKKSEKREQIINLSPLSEIRGITRFMIFASKHPGLVARIVTVVPLAGVHAGSALVWHEGRLLVVQDDAASAVWVDPVFGQTKRLILEGTGEPLEKSKKPDFEVAFMGPGQTITILGSGSSPARRRRAVVDLETNGVRIVDESLLFGILEQALGCVPNLEGAVVLDNRLRLFHRGAGEGKSATIDVNVDVLLGVSPHVFAVTPFDLGDVDGVPLHFTDATRFDERLVYVAVAEDTPNAIDDGPVVGAALGFLDDEGATWTTLIEASGEGSTRKIEGIAIDPRSGTIYGVTDPDDPDKLAELLTIELTGSSSLKSSS